MMSPAGASWAVVPALADGPEALLAAPDGSAPMPGAAAAAVGAATTADPAAVPDELAELPEHPASSIPPASMTPPIAKPATPNRVRPVRADPRFKLRVFNMPV
jgi:hypothetical protein